MNKVNNRKIINKIAIASLKNNRRRNIIAFIAIALTTLLFTSLFTIGFGMKNSMELETMRMVGTTFHGAFKRINKEDINKLKTHPLIKEIGIRQIIGPVINDEFIKEQVEISYGDENYIKRGFNYPTTGRLPIEKNEIITDTLVLDLLKIPHRVGEKIRLRYTIEENGIVLETIEDEFILSGFYDADEAMMARMVFTSKEYADSLNLPENIYYLDVMFSNSKNIEEKLIQVQSESGYVPDEEGPAIDIGVNWGYMSGKLEDADPITIGGMVLILLIIIFTGYLIIYNIFQISVVSDIKFYGLLKTVGTTKKQIMRIIRRQAFFISLIGIPIGLILGYFAGNLILPRIASTTSIGGRVVKSPTPWIFLFSILFSLITVFISCRKPGKIAGKVSPVEAVKITDIDKVNYDHIRKSEARVNISKMAMSNLFRNKIRTVIVLLSMSLSLILLNSVYTMTNSFDMNKYLSEFINSDFVLGSAKYFKSDFRFKEDSLTEDVIGLINSKKGFENGGRIYYTPADSVEFLDEKDLEPQNQTPIQLYGLDDYLIDRQKIIKGQIDVEKLKSGDYIIYGGYTNNNGTPVWDRIKYDVGDSVKLNTENGVKEFEVMAIISYDYTNHARYVNFISDKNGKAIHSQLLYLPSNVYKEIIKDPFTMVYQFDVEGENITDYESFLEDYTNSIDYTLDYDSRDKQKSDFDNYKNMFLLVGGSLSFIVALVGIVNFINSITTSIITRKREFALLQSIGMTRKQLNSMLIREGIFYSLGTMIISAIFSIVISITIIKKLTRESFFATYNFTLKPLAIALPIIIILGIILPYIINKSMVRESIVERIKRDD
ncbi:ABC transporter permease [Tissierella carlieri]|jgi:putative ABC transport system permease protein|uniref:ABC transporter permease n=1 Tax=Tissierella carlieri TaxID=689904 RepID=UPI001C121EDD|nr:ABC transporter permease [Tissierella carlieri]MBU5310692.1 ABC transporter permease [Tissierella carlieri]